VEKCGVRLFGRENELARLENWLQDRRSFLFYGPAGVGKTRLLDELAPRFPGMLRVSSCNTPQALFHELARALWQQRHPELRVRFKSAEQLQGASAANLKGLCITTLKDSRKLVILEHVGFSSQQFSAAVKQLAGETGLAVIFVARSCHMEDAGYLIRHYPDRNHRLELARFKAQQAAEFAYLVADQAGLQAENRAEFLMKTVELSEGNPGAIIAMVQMASMPKYRSGAWIKSAPLYIDFRLARNASLSSL
jgi:AAA ATPase-like protein